MNDHQKIRLLRVTGITEGYSFLVLLLVAMPLKYFLGMPAMVTVVGWMHGILFITYLVAVVIAADALRYSWLQVGIAFIAALIPVGTLLLDRGCRGRAEECRRAAIKKAAP